MRGTWFFVALFLSLAGCRADQQAAIESKCDAALRGCVQELYRAHADSSLDVLGQSTVALDEARQRKLEAAGAQVRQVTGDLFTARVAVKRVGDVASLDFVRTLALSQTRDPLKP